MAGPPTSPTPPGADLPVEPVEPALRGGQRLCPDCGTPYASGQEYCLECGLRLPAERGVVATLSSAWQRRLPWYPGDWLWPALLLLLIAALGAMVVILSLEDGKTGTLVATTSSPPTATSTASGGETAPTVPPAAPQPPAATPPPPAPPAAPIEWPQGQSGYTVVLASVPQSSGRASADAEVQKALDAGLTEVGVLSSSDFPILHPGYFVVFAGMLDSLQEATGAAEAARSSGFSQAYPRQITP